MTKFLGDITERLIYALCNLLFGWAALAIWQWIGILAWFDIPHFSGTQLLGIAVVVMLATPTMKPYKS